MADLGAQYQRLVVLGDFNIAPADIDVHDPEQWQDKIMCSQAERDHFFRLLNDNAMTDVFRTLNQDATEYSWWDYRQAAFRRNLGLRIDHILATAKLKPESCSIDKAPRALPRPSDHAPIYASFA